MKKEVVERDEAEGLLAEARKEVDGGAEGVLIFNDCIPVRDKIGL